MLSPCLPFEGPVWSMKATSLIGVPFAVDDVPATVVEAGLDVVPAALGEDAVFESELDPHPPVTAAAAMSPANPAARHAALAFVSMV
jgi:hypothetical protein